MSPHDDDFADEIRGIPYAEVEVPPARYAFPVWTLPALEPFTRVTIGGPGWWLIDELVVMDDPPLERDDGQLVYQVMPHAEWGASMMRQHPGEQLVGDEQRVYPREILAVDLWVYRDAVAEQVSVDQLEPFDPLAWYGRVMESTSVPPQVLSPRPARELPSLVGHRLRVRAPGGWAWMIAVSEPFQEEGEFVVNLVHAPDYWRAAYGRPRTTGKPWLYRYPLHCIWSY